MTPTILIAVATFKRPTDLEAFLTSLVPQLRPGVELLVVDNDPEGGAQTDVERWQQRVAERGATLTYAHEPQPGIVAVRNRSLAHFEAGGHGSIIFVDDDERMSSSWLDNLTRYAEGTTSGVIYGHVIAEYPDGTPGWMVKAEFQRGAVPADGDRAWTAATNNTLLKRTAWEAAGRPRFDPRFTTIGGSDTDLFSRIAESGITIERTSQAPVYEDFPATRARLSWLVRRAYRTGLVNGVVWRRRRSRLSLVALGAATTGLGVAASAWTGLTRRRLSAKQFNRVFYGVGLVGAQLNLYVHEYRRP